MMTAKWLNQLRWFAIAAQATTIVIVTMATSVRLPIPSLVTILGLEVVFGVICTILAHKRLLDTPGRLFGCMLGDIALLTTLLYFTGGPENPFNFLYLIHVTLGLVAIGERAAWALLVTSSALFGGLFVYNVPLHVHGSHGHDAHAMSLHMQGMWVGFVVAAIFILVFSSRLSRAVASRDRELAEARTRAQASERLAGLATLAAGAAHELNTPLSTIALVARELEHAAQALDEDADDIVEDARLIRTEIERCRAILDQLSVDAGAATGAQTTPHTAAAIVASTPHAASARVTTSLDPGDATVVAPLRSLTTALDALIDNALRATTGEVALHVSATPTDVKFLVRDDGPGMTEAVLSRAQEPFFTTHTDGSGMGLGLFLTTSVADALGGTLQLESSLDGGTVATLTLPRKNA